MVGANDKPGRRGPDDFGNADEFFADRHPGVDRQRVLEEIKRLDAELGEERRLTQLEVDALWHGDEPGDYRGFGI